MNRWKIFWNLVQRIYPKCLKFKTVVAKRLFKKTQICKYLTKKGLFNLFKSGLVSETQRKP
eukprot:UN15291